MGMCCFEECPEGVDWELGFAYFRTGKIGIEALGPGMEEMPFRVYRSFKTHVKSLNA